MKKISASFRDPSGFVFVKKNLILRQVNSCFKDDFDFFLNSGLYDFLVQKNLLVEHGEVSLNLKYDDNAYKLLKPKKLDFISYPYEWCFSQLKDAALLTLEIMKYALEKNMILKDASMFNIQFVDGKPVFIDTLSFERYEEGMPWSAYRQFCEHFLGPLAVMSYTNLPVNNLLRVYLDGVPLEQIINLLPLSAKLNPRIFMHLFVHGKLKSRYSNKTDNKMMNGRLSKQGLIGIIGSLEKTITGLNLKKIKTEWENYYSDRCNYGKNAFDNKKVFVEECLKHIKPKIIWDLGANNGEFSRIAAKYGLTISFDVDHNCVEENYLKSKANSEHNLLPLVMDITNPSPDLGFGLNERDNIIKRGPADVVFSLALLHHLVISNNIPLQKVASFLASICKYAIVEFVPKEDSQVQKLFANRKDIFSDYNISSFEQIFSESFKIIKKEKIIDSERTLYLLENISL